MSGAFDVFAGLCLSNSDGHGPVAVEIEITQRPRRIAPPSMSCSTGRPHEDRTVA